MWLIIKRKFDRTNVLTEQVLSCHPVFQESQLMQSLHYRIVAQNFLMLTVFGDRRQKPPDQIRPELTYRHNGHRSLKLSPIFPHFLNLVKLTTHLFFCESET